MCNDQVGNPHSIGESQQFDVPPSRSGVCWCAVNYLTKVYFFVLWTRN